MSNEAILMLVRGLPRVPADDLSAEIGLDSIDLLDVNGFSEADYEMKFPAIKSGTPWAESPITDGRRPMTGAVGNVIESIRLELTSGTILQMAAAMSKLHLFVGYVQAFWGSTAQNNREPVYIKHYVPGEYVPRYALIYDISVAETTPLIPGTPTRSLTISIEREHYWRGLAPGDNPKRWYVEHVAVGQKWDATKTSLVSGGDHLATAQIDNCQEFLTTTTFQSKSWIDIPADRIAGDAPPLVCVTVNSPVGFTTDFHIASITNRTSITDRNGAALPLYHSFALSATNLQSGTAAFLTDAGRGIAHVPVSPNKRTVIVTPVGATEVNIGFWTVTANFAHLNPLVLQGRYAVYLRASQIGGTAGTCKARVIFSATQGDFFDSGLQTITDDTTAGVGMNYMGVITLPPDDHSNVGLLGKGYTAEYDFSVILSTQRTAGVGTIRLVDIVLMPLGSYVYIQPELNLSPDWYVFYDDTGYLTHGISEPVGGSRRFSGNTEFNALSEFSGQLSLEPKVNNRLYFVEYYTGGQGSSAGDDFTPRINLIPRWVGLSSK